MSTTGEIGSGAAVASATGAPEVLEEGTWRGWSAVTLLTVLTGAGWVLLGDGRLDGFGNHDFIQYWSAFGVARGGLDPYSPEQLLAAERSVGWSSPVPLMMWNPPWLLLLLAPVLALPYQLAAKVFLACNLLAAVALARFASDIFAERRMHRPWCATAIVLLCAPVYVALSTGQLSIGLAAALALLIRSATRDASWSGAAALLVLSLKPHLFVLTLLVLGWWMLRHGRFFRVIPCAVLLLALSIVLVRVFFGETFGCWVETLGGSRCSIARGAAVPMVGVFDWRVATLVGALSGAIPGLSLAAHKLIMIAVPAAAAIVVLLRLRRNASGFAWQSWLAPVTCLSLATSPYGWLFDMSATALVPLRILYLRGTAIGVRRREAGLLLAASFLVQAITLALLKTKTLVMHHQFFWYSLLLFVLGCVAEWRLGKGVDEGSEKPAAD